MKENNKVPKIRFPEFTDAWKQCRLGDVGEYFTTNTLSYSDLDPKGKYKCVLYGDLYTKFNEKIFNVISRTNNEGTKTEINDILFPTSTTVDNISLIAPSCVSEENIRVGGDMFGIRPYKYIDGNFISYYINNYMPVKLSFAKKAQGLSIIHLQYNAVKTEKLMIPSKKEQLKISGICTRIDHLITLHQRKLENLEKRKKGLLQNMFPSNDEKVPKIRFPEFDGEWRKCRLGDVGCVEMNRRIFKDETTEIGEIPFYKIGTFGSNADAFISRELFETYREKYPYPNKGDLLLSASGSIGRFIEYNGEEAYYQDSNIVWLNHNNNLENKFLKAFYRIVKWQGIEGTTIKRLYNKNILETIIDMPSKTEQKSVGDLFEKLDTLNNLYQRKLQHLKLLKKGLLQQMFV